MLVSVVQSQLSLRPSTRESLFVLLAAAVRDKLFLEECPFVVESHLGDVGHCNQYFFRRLVENGSEVYRGLL